ncbi:MerR family transcriptional regulator [Pleionea sp. CnH1-48]|uniref:MerR family transcriptional regulator n=1 Tax=Pleionea sp. CnH1-48 TaxID=2954494 RepID=UPI002097F43D|nr:MerR family transcriptional regulator [Pleionea sp. CnH1-48]MCO7226040.1 MerR family transcriptional regulator [Pleionea sp. CnH1-48]
MSTKERNLSIGTVARLVGISPHALRVWESRYKVNLSHRAENGRRIYDAGSVERLKLIKRALDLGYVVSEVIHLSMTELSSFTYAQEEPFGIDKHKRGVLIFGDHLSHLLFQSRVSFYYHSVNKLSEVAEFCSHSSAFVSALVMEFSDINDEIEELLYSIFITMKGKPVVIYSPNLEPERHQRLVNAGIQVEMADVDEGVLSKLQALLAEKTDIQRNKHKPSFLDHQQIQALLNHQSSVQCQCPQHLADLYMSIDKFIQYNAYCERKSPKDTAIHSYLKEVLYDLRSRLVSATYDVAAMDGIVLNEDR